ncbi:zinc-binding dehydrogenase [Baekduia soli]|uniref:Zinc-binding dehydrogenase n=1 Tax=Baekduia soli TaxID=496014 RepID=A0A5B8U5Z3_9ACTN|nr:zinc-binding dehydrogenase [Baekduia soli]QEC48407.1 zinc-binding dehydrogenase [Baekduia soli]
MKAAVMREFGGSSVLNVEDVEDPEPGPGHVRIKVDACALNHVDVDIRDGISRFDITFPHIPGIEIVGRVDALGDGVEDYAVGDRVMPYLLGGEVFIGVAGPGGFAEYVTAPAGQLVRVPEAISDDDAAALQVAFGTAWHMLFTRGGLRIGETVLINSISSGIGSAAVQLAHLAGAYVIGTSSSAEKLAQASALGMDDGIDYTTEDVPARVAELTGGKGADLAFEHVGGELFQKAIESLGQDGRLVTCGGHSGEVVPFDVIPFFRSQHTIIGSFVYTRDELEKALDFAARGLIKPLVSASFGLDEIQEAYSALEARKHFGKILVRP